MIVCLGHLELQVQRWGSSDGAEETSAESAWAGRPGGRREAGGPADGRRHWAAVEDGPAGCGGDSEVQEDVWGLKVYINAGADWAIRGRQGNAVLFYFSPSVALGVLVLAVVEEVKLLIPHSKSPASRFLLKVKSGIIGTIRLHLLVAGGAFDSDHAR